MNTQQPHVYEHQCVQLSVGSLPINDRRLADARETLKGAMRGNEKIIVSRFEVRIPNSYMQGFIFDGNKLVTDLIGYMKNMIRKAQQQRCNGCEPVAMASVDAIWQSRMANGYGVRYRIALLLNPEAFYKQHPFKHPQEVLMDRIIHAWARVSNQTIPVARQQVHFPAGWSQAVEASRYGFEEIFPRISVLCEDPDGDNGAVFAGFGTTRRA